MATMLLHKNNHKTSVECINRPFFLLLSRCLAGPSYRSAEDWLVKRVLADASAPYPLILQESSPGVFT